MHVEMLIFQDFFEEYKIQKNSIYLKWKSFVTSLTFTFGQSLVNKSIT